MKSLNDKERKILTAFKRGRLKSVATSEAALRRYREYARLTLAKAGRVSIRPEHPEK